MIQYLLNLGSLIKTLFEQIRKDHDQSATICIRFPGTGHDLMLKLNGVHQYR